MIKIENKTTDELTQKELKQILDGFNQVFSLNRPIPFTTPSMMDSGRAAQPGT